MSEDKKCVAEVYLRLADRTDIADVNAKVKYGWVKINGLFLQWGLEVTDEGGSYTVALVELQDFADDIEVHKSEMERCFAGQVFSVIPNKLRFLHS